MTCYYPMLAYDIPTNDGKRKLKIFSKTEDYDKKLRPNREKWNNPGIFPLPCGKCIGCRLDKASEWAARCVHEASMHEDNCFVTLTYNDDNIPENSSLVKEDLQNFIKRVRKKFAYPGEMPLFDKAMRLQYYTSKAKKYEYRYGKVKVSPVYRKIRYFASGEYGDPDAGVRVYNPHYHIIFFGINFHDKEIRKLDKGYKNKGKFRVGYDHSNYYSKTLENLWYFGFHSIGSVTRESAGYVARYTLSKFTNQDPKKVKEYYGKRIPEFAMMSRRPGIGYDWFVSNKTDVFPKDYFTIEGVKVKAPRFYGDIMEEEDPKMMERIKENRKKKQLNSNEAAFRLLGKDKYKRRAAERLRGDL